MHRAGILRYPEAVGGGIIKTGRSPVPQLMYEAARACPRGNLFVCSQL